jgi:hypothetical protein
MFGEMIKEALHTSDNRQLPTQYPYRNIHMDNVWGTFWELQPHLCIQDLKAWQCMYPLKHSLAISQVTVVTADLSSKQWTLAQL